MTKAEALAVLIDRLQAGERIRDEDPFEPAVGLRWMTDLILAATGDREAVARLEQDRRSHGWRGLVVSDRTDRTPPRWIARWTAPALASGEADREWHARLIAVLKARQHDAESGLQTP